MIIDLARRWTPRARCAGMDVEGFFVSHAPNLRNPSRKLRLAWEEAKAVCEQCPVKRQCARDHLGEIEGVWGGLDPLQRKDLRALHSQRVKRLTGPLKDEYARLAWHLHERGYTIVDIGRIVGIGRNTASHLCDWYREHLEGQDDASSQVPVPQAAGLTVEKVSRTYGTTRYREPRHTG